MPRPWLPADPTPAAIEALLPQIRRGVSRPAPSKLLALWLYLPIELDTANGRVAYRSSLDASLRNCREAADRDANGVRRGAGSGSWLAAMGYLALVDQIGSAVTNRRPRHQTPSGRNSFERALADFTSLNNQEASCLYALRNSLAHGFSLINISDARVKDPVRRRLLTRMFTLTRGASGLIEWPAHEWNPSRPHQGGATIVDVGLLGDLVEELVRELRVVYAAGDLCIRLERGRVSPALWRAGRFFVHAV
jgi:hypothetical protein